MYKIGQISIWKNWYSCCSEQIDRIREYANKKKLQCSALLYVYGKGRTIQIAVVPVAG